MKTLILGMGNTLLSDDGMGIITKRYLEKRLDKCDTIDFCETSWGGFRIIDLLRGYDYAIIVDSIKTKSKPAGYIHFLQPNDLLPTLRLTSYHDINFITALKLAEQLGTKIPSDIEIYAIEIENNDTINEYINPSLWNSIVFCTDKILVSLQSKGIINEIRDDLVKTISLKTLRELYIEESDAEHSTYRNNTLKQEEYLV